MMTTRPAVMTHHSILGRMLIDFEDLEASRSFGLAKSYDGVILIT